MIARSLLRKIFEEVGGQSKDTALDVEFADGSVCRTTPSRKQNEVSVRFRNRRGEWHTLLFFYEGLFESFVSGDVDLEGDQPIATLARLGHASALASPRSWARMLRNPLIEMRQQAQEWRQNGDDHAQAARNADFHYALPPVLFEAMLGHTVGYSEGLWTPETKTLDQAKFNNYEYICRKLRLEPGMKVVDVGAGWGYLPIYLTKRYDVEVTVYNPVRRQNDYMLERFRRHGVDGKIRLVEGDHRDIVREAGRFDRFVSIGVQEHAGYKLKQYRLWAEAIAASLKEGGLGVVSTTSWMVRQMTGLLTLKYIFPGGHVPSLPDTLRAFDQAGLMLLDVENLWPHYQRTMEAWRKNFAEAWPRVRASDPDLFTERFRRRWTMYLEATGEAFGDSLDLSHIVFAKGRRADCFQPRQERPHGDIAFVGGDEVPECYR
ncbi:SAM-dependent methyltransferase [Labrys monachus]|uniref:Cyclopropane-fatty-acyl-phospholipid synthase n=1 Tax=Labrys monachus TaxID=217067 RepID=A0ABU0FDH9_9HYPH|nr:cyclopropane-fatty-acyl-phospholipid synthase family protein [Labrys monachus]MDQ0392663.1 cyclopropane-fatty-acyl-phospholipid synthase [Labrys monachus]